MDQIFGKHWFLNGIRQPKVLVANQRHEESSDKTAAEHLERKADEV